MIPDHLLQEYQGKLISLKDDHLLFEENDVATYYYQVQSGQVKMYVTNPDGQLFTLGLFGNGESFGEPALLGNFNYPGSARTTMASKIWRLPREKFLLLLKDNFEIHIKLNEILCQRLQYKSMVLRELSSYDAEHRIATLLKYFRSRLKIQSGDQALVPFTRQELADMTGLRVETVIRTVKKMETAGKLSMNGHKIKL